jgi:hypothetical protein
LLGHDAQLDLALLWRTVGVVNGLGGVFHQVDQHLLDQDRVHHQLRQTRCDVVRQAHMASAHLDLGQLQGLTDHGRHIGQGAVGFTALDEASDAQNDLSSPLRLVGCFLQCPQQVFFFDLLVFDARDHAAAIVADGREWLVQLMRHAGGHFAHGDQSTRGLCALGLLSRQLFGLTARGDVTGNHHLRQTAIGPVDVTRTHFEPLAQFGDKNLCVF